MSFIFCMSTVCHLYVTRMSFVCTCMLSVCYSYVLVCNGMSLIRTRISSIFYSYVLVYHSYFTRMYSYHIRMSLICISMSSVCHSYVLACHPYVTRMWFYHEPKGATDRIISQPEPITKNLKWIQMGGKNKLDNLKVATQASRQRKRILLFFAIASLSMLIAIKFKKNWKLLSPY